ncbi:MAG: HD domain-containing protein [Ruminococcus sp.]|uniref:HD domain-containing protein n=1 Tax=Ruminococcus sp. TaxID=41978 RepID=UPI0025CBDD29|nr:HD domain-containing protein [Ruminococcus sp.]MCR5600175.1 HD domain-containing protein [Ruminococcus sp.]
MIYTAMTCKAMKLAYDAHHGQLDKNGVPYIFHPYHLAEEMQDEYTTCAALLHDTVEDTDVTIAMLEKEFPPEVTEAVKLLTHDKDTDYFEYIKAIKTSAVAKAVKLADLHHNSDLSRFINEEDRTAPKTIERLKKYSRAIELLTDIN